MKQTTAVLYVAPTGSGKTVVFGHIAARIVERGRRALILVHRRELLRQAIEKLALFGVEAGAIQAGTPEDRRHAIQVASVQTLVNREPPAADLVIIDEAHHCAAATWIKVLALYPDAYKLGVTATPERLDGKGLRDHFSQMVLGPSVAELIEQGYLAKPRILTVPAPDLSGIKTVAGDYAVKQLGQVMTQDVLVGNAVDHYLEHAAGKSAIAFCVTVEHAQQVARRFSNAGISAASVDGTMDTKLRDQIIGGLASGRFQVVTSCALISEGLDIPDVGCALLLRPTKSLAMNLQQIGRALRPKRDGSEAIILDHAGNCQRHGHPAAPRLWSLDGRPIREQAERAEREREETETKQSRFVLEINARLVELGYPNLRAEDLKRMALQAALTICKSWDDVERLRRLRGYKPGWVHHVMRERRARA